MIGGIFLLLLMVIVDGIKGNGMEMTVKGEMINVCRDNDYDGDETLIMLTRKSIVVMEDNDMRIVESIELGNDEVEGNAIISKVDKGRYVIGQGVQPLVVLIGNDGIVLNKYQPLDISLKSVLYTLLLFPVKHDNDDNNIVYYLLGWRNQSKHYLVMLDFQLKQINSMLINDAEGIIESTCLTLTQSQTSFEFLCMYISLDHFMLQLYEGHYLKTLNSINQVLNFEGDFNQGKLLLMNNSTIILSCLQSINSTVSCLKLYYNHPSSPDNSTGSLSPESQAHYHPILNNFQCSSSEITLGSLSSLSFILLCINDHNLIYQINHINFDRITPIGTIHLDAKISLINLIIFPTKIDLFYALNDEQDTSHFDRIDIPICSNQIIYTRTYDVKFNVAFVRNGLINEANKEGSVVFETIDKDALVYYDDEDKVEIGRKIIKGYDKDYRLIDNNEEEEDARSYHLEYYIISEGGGNTIISDMCSINIIISKGITEDECDDNSIESISHCIKCHEESSSILITNTNTKSQSQYCFPFSAKITNYYLNSITNTFNLCYSSCQTCSTLGTITQHKCLKCKSNFYPIPSSNLSTFNCFNPAANSLPIPNYFFNDTANSYQKCSNSCYTCYSSPTESDTNCHKCNLNFIQDPNDSSNCLPSCEPFNWLINKTSNTFQCTSSFSCPSSYPILNKTTFECLSSCPDNQFQFLHSCITQCPSHTITDKPNRKCLYISSSLSLEDIQQDIISFPRNQPINGKGFIAQIYQSINSTIEENREIALGNNLTYVDFKECIHVLKSVWNVPKEEDVLIAKIELLRSNATTNQIEYMLFTMNGNRLDLSVCDELNITVNYALVNDEEVYLDIAHRLMNESGIDIYNMSDGFFNDFCYPFTSEDGTDVIIADRRTHYFKNISFCEANCSYLKVDIELRRVECICPIKDEVERELKENGYSYKKDEEMEEENELTSSNYLVLMCYQRVFDGKILKVNIGNYIFLFMFAIELGVSIHFLVTSTRAVTKHIVQLKNYEKENGNGNVIGCAPPRRISNNPNGNGNVEEMMGICNALGMINQVKENEKEKDKMDLKKITVQSFKTASTNETVTQYQLQTSAIRKNQINTSHNNFIIDFNNNHHYHQRRKAFGCKSTITSEKTQSPADTSFMTYEDMTYEKAILKDTRTFILLYINLIHSKHILLTLILPNTTLFYKPIKFSIFMLSTATDFFFNAFFYSDEYMNRRFISKGEESFWITVPKSLFSYFITGLVTLAMEYLTETKFYFHAKLFMAEDKFLTKCKDYLRRLRLKLVIYFVLNWIMILFFWYYVTAFCGVYQNSQISWLLSTLLSFGISMVTPFMFAFGIGVVRMVALRYRMKWLFKVSNLLWAIV